MTRILTIIALLLATPAWAGITYSEFEDMEGSGPEFALALQAGLLIGNTWMNQASSRTNEEGRTIFCPPENMAVNGKNLRDAMSLAVELEPELRQQPLGLVALRGLIATFPCN